MSLELKGEIDAQRANFESEFMATRSIRDDRYGFEDGEPIESVKRKHGPGFGDDMTVEGHHVLGSATSRHVRSPQKLDCGPMHSGSGERRPFASVYAPKSWADLSDCDIFMVGLTRILTQNCLQ